MTWMSHYKAEILKDLGGLIMTDKERLNKLTVAVFDNAHLELENQKLRAGLIEIIKDSEEFVNLYSKEGTLTLEQTNLCNHFGNIATNTLEGIK